MSRTSIDIFAEALPTAAAQALSEKTAAAWTFTVDENPKPFPAGTQLLTLLVVAEPSKAEAAIQIGAENALLLAAALAGAAAAPSKFLPEHAEALRALLAQACEKAAAALAGTQIKVRLAKAISWTPARQLSLAGTDGASRNIQFQFLFSADWPQIAATSQSASDRPAPTAKGVDVSLLENVEIEVTLQFGERRLPLREIGELRSGCVVELDKYVQDPAELLLGDRVVARGDVVVVEGNYALRITEVL